MYIHPLLIFFTSCGTFHFAAAYTSRGSPLRYGGLLILILCAYYFPAYLVSFTSSSTSFFARTLSGGCFWNIFSYTDRLLLKRWDYYHYGPVAQSSDSNVSLDSKKIVEGQSHFSETRMDFGSEVTGNARGIGLFSQAKNVPNFHDLRPDYVPSRLAFVLVQTTVMSSCFFAHNMTVRMTVGLNPRYLTSAYIPFFARLPDVSIEELKSRFLSTVGCWIIAYTAMQTLYSLFALISAITDSSNIKLWPPHFGSLSSAYTLRKFWGKFWHQDLRLVLEGVSSFITHDVLRLPRHGILQRYSKIFCSFTMSGMMHVAADAGIGIPVSDSGALTFFIMQALGIVIEDLVKATHKRFSPSQFGSTISTLERPLGYLWVLAFLVWTTPVWQFAVQRRMSLEDDLLHLGAFPPLLMGRSR